MPERKVILKAEHLTKRYGGVVAVNDVSLELYENEILGLIGPNGAGKTTTFNLISGTVKMTSGEISVQNKKIRNVKAHLMTSYAIGRTFQIVQPFSSLTVLENTMVGAFLHTSSTAKAREYAMEVLKSIGLEHKAEILGRDLSLIDLKRMEVAKALATNPRILLLDEVMAGLNPTEGAEVVEMIRNIRASGISIILVEHVMKAVMSLCDRIIVLDQGKLIATGTPAEISTNPRVLESYLGVNHSA